MDDASQLQRRRTQAVALGVAVFVLLGANFGALASIQLQQQAADVVDEAAGPPAVVERKPKADVPRKAANHDAPRQRRQRQQRRHVKPQLQQAQPRPTPSPAPVPPPAPLTLPAVPVDHKLAPFTGLSTWIDIYDTELSAARQVDIAAAGGVQTIFVQSGKYNSRSVQFPRRLATVIERSHDYGLRVMVWYVPGFVNPQRDFNASAEAMAFTTPRGDRADAFGLDIEVEKLSNTTKRTERLLDLSEALRRWAGDSYPMSAIVLPPLQLDLRPSWWPDFPYAELAAYYDVFIPMSYSSFRGTDAETTYRWNLENVREMRRRAGIPTLPVHLAGGIADNLPELGAFIRAASAADVLGAGLYDLDTTHPQAWLQLRQLRVDSG